MFLLESVQTTGPSLTKIKPVTVSEFTSKFNQSADMILEILGNLVIPIVSICFLLAIITYITGGIIHSDKVRKAGAGGILAALLGFFIYIISPYIMGVLYGIAQIFK